MPSSLTCVKTGERQVAMTTIPYPEEPGPGQALVRTTLSTICGSDIHIVDELPLAQSTVSEHLRILRSAGLVQANENGPRVSYCIVPSALKRLKALLEAV